MIPIDRKKADGNRVRLLEGKDRAAFGQAIEFKYIIAGFSTFGHAYIRFQEIFQNFNIQYPIIPLVFG